MKICIPTVDDHGLQAKSYGHVGGAPFYTIVDTESGDVRAIRNAALRRRRGECGPGAGIRALEADAVVCSDIGRKAFASMDEAGVEVYRSEEPTVAQILDGVRAGTLKRVSLAEACGGHRRRCGHGHHDSDAAGWFG